MSSRLSACTLVLGCSLALSLVACADACGKREQASPAAAKTQIKAEDERVIACSALPAAMIGDVLDIPGLELTSEKIEGKATLCQYETKGAASKYVSIRVERGYAPERFEASKSAFPNATDVAGLGDKAFVSDLPMVTAGTPTGIHGVAVLKKRTHLTISGPADSQKVQYLARELLESL